MTDDSLRDVVSSFGASDLAAAIAEEYDDKLMRDVGPLGQPIEDIANVHRGARQYDHGQASDQTVSQAGVKAVFDPAETALESIKEGGRIHHRLWELGEQHLDCAVVEVDVMTVSAEEYVVWVIADTEELL